jgi:hypothetical protein
MTLVWKPIEAPADLTTPDAEVRVSSRLGAWTFRRREESADVVLPRHQVAIGLGKVRWDYLAEEPELALASDLVVVAQIPTLYLIWSLHTERQIGVADVTAGSYRHSWYDIEAGRVWSFQDFLDGGNTWWEPPPECPKEVLLVVARSGR